MPLYQEYSLGGVTFMALILVYLGFVAGRGYPAQPWLWRQEYQRRRR